MNANQTALKKLNRTAPVFAALGSEERLRLVLWLSKKGPTSITELTRGSEVTRQGITKHLRALAGAGLVKSVHEGRETLWELERERFEEARQSLDAISSQWDDALGRLKSLVES